MDSKSLHKPHCVAPCVTNSLKVRSMKFYNFRTKIEHIKGGGEIRRLCTISIEFCRETCYNIS